MGTAADERFDTCFDALAAIAYRVAYRVLGSRAEAEDVAQEALARAYARWGKVEGHAEAWVARVSTNLAIGVWRARRPAGDAGDGGDRGSAPRDAATLDRLELSAVLARLPRRQREVVALRYLADLTEADVASVLGCSLGTVKQHAHRGLGALRSALTFEEGGCDVRALG